LWTWSLNWGEITPSIVIGTCPMTPADIGRIHSRARVSALLSLQHDDCLAYWNIDYEAMRSTARRLELVLARCPIRDFDLGDMRRTLPEAVSVLAALIGGGHRTYVHCTAGQGRAPLTVLGYLMLVENYSGDDAIRRILAGRPHAVPAWEALHGACDDLERRYRDEIEQFAHKLHEAGVNRDPLTDWNQAKAMIFRQKLTPPFHGRNAEPL